MVNEDYRKLEEAKNLTHRLSLLIETVIGTPVGPRKVSILTIGTPVGPRKVSILTIGTPVGPRKVSILTIQAIDHTFYGFTGVITNFGCWESTRKAVVYCFYEITLSKTMSLPAQ